MMEIILKRVSIRRFSTQELSRETIKKILQAAMQAPSAGNEQPWEFIIAETVSLKEKIAQVSPYASMAKEAAAIVVVLGNLTKESFKGFWVQDCAACAQNILLAASALGIGSVWLGIHPLTEREDYLRKLFDLPSTIIPFAVIPLGYPAEEKEAVSRYNEQRIHFNQW